MSRPTFKKWNFNKDGKKLSGIFDGQVPNLGKFHSTLFFIRTKNGTRWAIWGTLGIKRKLQWLEVGRPVTIEFKGKVKQKNGYTVHNYKITTPRVKDTKMKTKKKKKS